METDQRRVRLPSWDCELVQHDYNKVGEVLAPGVAPEDRAAIVFADPPYNYGIKYADDDTKDRLSQEEYEDLTLNTLSALNAAGRPGGTLWWMVPEEHADWVGPMLTRLIGPRMYRIVWYEPFSQYQGDRALTKDYRFIFCHRFTTNEGVPSWNPDNIRIPSSRQIIYNDARSRGKKQRVPGTLWEFDNPQDREGLVKQLVENLHEHRFNEDMQRKAIENALAIAAGSSRVPGDVWKFRRLQGTSDDRVEWHPCQLPPELLVRIVRGWSNPGDLVIDAFAGSGSLGRVCRALNRRFLGVDKSPTYIDKMSEALA